MALTWGQYRSVIRRTILNDVAKTTWPDDDVLLDCFGWALDAFCAHTALATSMAYTSVSRELPVPEDMFSDLISTGKLYLTVSSKVYNVPALDLMEFQDSSQLTYSVYGDTITFTADPPTTGMGKLYYFAYYPKPVLDADLVLLPRWSLNAVAHLVGAYALTENAMQIASINQWKSREDSGNPIQNAIEVQQRWMLKFYENELARFPNQNRENYYQRLVVT